jgi:hypothetical protein
MDNSAPGQRFPDLAAIAVSKDVLTEAVQPELDRVDSGLPPQSFSGPRSKISEFVDEWAVSVRGDHTVVLVCIFTKAAKPRKPPRVVSVYSEFIALPLR